MKITFSVSGIPPLLAVVAIYLLLGTQSPPSPLEFLLAALILSSRSSGGSS